MRVLLYLVMFMTNEVLAKNEDWMLFNSSLLIEVTRPKGVFTCTGVAVAPEIVMTAAHCLEGDVTSVKIFTQMAYDPKQPYLEIKDYKLHPDYNPKKSSYVADVAKIRMKTKLPSSIRLHPIYEGNRFNGEFFRFGFGARHGKNVRTVVTPSLRSLNIQENIVEFNDKFSRSGDSGGPIYMQNENGISILAVHSTFSHGPEGEYSLNPRLSQYLPWIYQN
jgi:secreted trypsin-like serine protease